MGKLYEIFEKARQANLDHDDERFLSYMTDDIEYYYHVGTRPLIGKGWVQKFLI